MSSDDEQTVCQFDWDVTPPSVAVVQTVSEATDRDESELRRLVDFVDPDGLDDLINRTDAPLRIEFEYERHSVVVLPSGRVTATPL